MNKFIHQAINRPHLSILILVLVFAFGILGFDIVRAWTEPGSSPPAGNVSPPLNTSSTGQSKAGGLILNTGGAAVGLIVDNAGVTSAGKVGLGTTNPQTQLHVAKASAGGANWYSLATAILENSGYNYLNIRSTNSTGGGIIFSDPDAASGWSGAISYSHANDSLGLATAGATALTILSNGQIGIGTSNPQAKLEVSGNIKLSGATPTYTITNLASPTANSDATTKAYVDAAVAAGGSTDWPSITNKVLGGLKTNSTPYTIDDIVEKPFRIDETGLTDRDGDGIKEHVMVSTDQLWLGDEGHFIEWRPNRVFLSGAYYGNLGGVSGADAKCQATADAAGLGGVYYAWIATNSTNDPIARFNKNVGWINVYDKKLIAQTWADLTDGTIANVITLISGGVPGLTRVWTNVAINGGVENASGGAHCDSWTRSTWPSRGFIGQQDQTNGSWTDYSIDNICNTPAAIYCFEQ